jgi:glutathione peroxidase-family protein
MFQRRRLSCVAGEAGSIHTPPAGAFRVRDRSAIEGKVAVNGKDAHPLFRFLKHAKPGLLGSESIKWNFTKFLVDRNGAVVERYAPMTKPEELQTWIEALL